ncbi:DUF6985 domain-containing protein [Photobacterium toruni]|uniref:DUF6985 domain-containing protein n=1 Tax=Photobacterium toruni TaxID=1935446 RepID=A0A1T4UIG0_9GAMM|nr:hypothetical protein [Photobacterium toruni]SKA52328.1 hypothetical protein CZ814_03275 [Photobacterium toruni]
MIKTIDKVFGELTFSTAWKRSYDVIFFDKLYKILLIVEENDDDRKTIREEQRDSYIYYSQNKVIIEKKIEEILISYTKEFLSEYGMKEENEDKIINSIEPTVIIFPMVLDDGDLNFGFLFESKFDPENGVGIQYINGNYEVSTQDILT